MIKRSERLMVFGSSISWISKNKVDNKELNGQEIILANMFGRVNIINSWKIMDMLLMTLSVWCYRIITVVKL